MNRKKRIYKGVNLDTNTCDQLKLDIDDCIQHNKLELLAEAEIFEDTNFSIDGYIDGVNTALAALGVEHKQDDLMYIKFKLVHAGVNKNKDEFLEEELIRAEKTPILKLLNWAHLDPSIGVIYRSVYRKSDNELERDYLECYAAISKFKYRKQAEEVLRRYNSKNLFFSMETFFKEAECSVCHGVFEDEEQYCQHLRNRFVSMGNVSRILHVLNFAGAAVVTSPADINAEALALASEITNSIDEEEKLVTIKASELVAENEATVILETVESQEATIEENKNSVTDLSNTNESIADDANTTNDTNHTEVIELLKKELDDTKKMLQSISEKYGILETEKSSVTERLENLASEFANYKSEVVANERVRSRADELLQIGYSFPEKEEDKNVVIAQLKSIDDNSFMILKSFINSTKQLVVQNDSIVTNNSVDASVNDNSGDSVDIPLTSVNDNSEKNNLIESLKRTVKDIL